MKISCAYTEMRDLVNLVPHPKNYNLHSDNQIKLLSKIMDFQGWRHPIIVSKRSGFIVAGHGRLMAARKLGWDKAPIDLQDFPDDATELAFLIADNKIHELAETDDIKLNELSVELGESFDHELLGMEDVFISEKMMPDMPSGEKSEFEQITFTLHKDQATEINNAIIKSIKLGDFDSLLNTNKNGNAITRICEWFLNADC